MFNLKKFAVAAALTLVATAAMASNFRAADQVYLPIAGHIGGGSGLFISDVFLSNLESDNVTVSLIYSTGAGGTQNTSLATIQLAAGERKEMTDFFGTLGLSGIGQVIFNGCKTGGNCNSNTCPGGDPSAGTCPDFRKISVESRIFSVPNSTAPISSQNTTGQDMPGLPWYSYASMDQAANGLDKVFITGVRFTGTAGSGTYRTNIGLVNASQYSTTTLKVTVFNSTGTALGTGFQTLGPLGQVQPSIANFVTPNLVAGPTQTGLWAQVEQVSSTPTNDAPAGCGANGCPGFFAYGSILDNASGDATTLEPQFFKSLDYALGAIYPGTSGSGKSGLRHIASH
jgi:hypothetical protein